MNASQACWIYHQSSMKLQTKISYTPGWSQQTQWYHLGTKDNTRYTKFMLLTYSVFFYLLFWSVLCRCNCSLLLIAIAIEFLLQMKLQKDRKRTPNWSIFLAEASNCHLIEWTICKRSHRRKIQGRRQMFSPFAFSGIVWFCILLRIIISWYL